VAQLYPRALGSLFVASYDSQGYGGGIRPRQPSSLSQSQSHIAIDGQSINQPEIYYPLIVTVLLFLGALFDKRTGLSFAYATGPRQRSLSRVRVPILLSQI
jgi:hypothetical protein